MSDQNIFLVGLMAVGKSTVGRLLAEALHRPFYDSDDEIEARAGAEIGWIFDVEGELGFREREEQVIDELSKMSGIVVATGGGAVKGIVCTQLVDRPRSQRPAIRRKLWPVLLTQPQDGS